MKKYIVAQSKTCLEMARDQLRKCQKEIMAVIIGMVVLLLKPKIYQTAAQILTRRMPSR